MLVKVVFNKKLFKFREEDEKYLLLYNLRCGDIFYITGNAKKILLNLNEKIEMNVDTEDDIVRVLLLLKIIVLT